MIEDYFREIQALVSGSWFVTSSTLTYDRRTSWIGFIRGELYFSDGSLLHVREFVDSQPAIVRYMYAYHYQRANGSFAIRYDNTPHFPGLQGFPHHKHEGSETTVVAATALDLASVLQEIGNSLSLSGT